MTKDQGPSPEFAQAALNALLENGLVLSPEDAAAEARAQPLNDRPLPSVGWRVVPEEPTDDMVAASMAVLSDWRKSLTPDERMMHSQIVHGRQRTYMDAKEKHRARYRAMLAAAPLPPPKDMEAYTASLPARVSTSEVPSAWRPIGPKDGGTLALLWAPAERLSDDPLQRPEMNYARPRDWTWATMMLEVRPPATPGSGSGGIAAPGHTDLMVTPESIGPFLVQVEAAKLICDFMNWPEDGPAWDDANKLAKSVLALIAATDTGRGE